MMPQINVSNALMDKLKSVAEPFIDTPETVIARCVDFYISKHGAGSYPKAESEGPNYPTVYAAEDAPDLTFTRLTAVTLEGVNFQKKDLYWNALLFDVVAKAPIGLTNKAATNAIEAAMARASFRMATAPASLPPEPAGKLTRAPWRP